MIPEIEKSLVNLTLKPAHMNIHLETDRFILRDIEETDLRGMYDLDSDPEVHTYLGTLPIETLEEARETINNIRNQYDEHGIGRWAVIDKSNLDFVGWSGLKYEKKLRKEFDYFDIGYRLRRKYWGQGIASETALECLRYGFEKMHLDEICGAAEVRHIVSNHILRKIGLNFIEQFDLEGVLVNFYGIDKAEWQNQKELW